MPRTPIKKLASAIGLCAFASFGCVGQSTPNDFAQLSLQALMNVPVGDAEDEHEAVDWHLSYSFKTIRFDDYYSGTDRIDLEKVFWRPGPGQPRTMQNYPVVPIDIKQNAHIFTFGYHLAEHLELVVTAPYIEQETDHLSIVPGYDRFTISSSGLGDINLQLRYTWHEQNVAWRFGAGVSLANGSIDEQGDTPRSPGDQQLPYTMQLGSGTLDIPVSLVYQWDGNICFKFGLDALIRTGKNDRDYRLGDIYRATAKTSFPVAEELSLFAAAEFTYWQSIKGQDEALLVPSVMPYPASITDPQRYGGTKVNARVGMEWKFSRFTTVGAEVGKPLLQNLNGPQPGEAWSASMNFKQVF